jgi:hypothetical protein
MRRDLHVGVRICYLGEKELGKAQAPLHSASPRDASRCSRPLGIDDMDQQFVATPMEPEMGLQLPYDLNWQAGV